jgi:hypothetical protein
VPKKKQMKIAPPRWKWSDGWRAAAWAVLCAEAILAGGDRPCMPSFNVAILLNQMLFMHLFGLAEFLGVCAAGPAFVVAATPKSIGIVAKRRMPTVIGVAIIALNLQLFVHDPIFWLPVYGMLIGLSIRWYPWIRSNWIVIALITAVALGVIQFSGLQYGQSNCWP